MLAPAALTPANRLNSGAGEGNRTPDPLITNQMLYRLSYASNTGDRRAIAQAYPFGSLPDVRDNYTNYHRVKCWRNGWALPQAACGPVGDSREIRRIFIDGTREANGALHPSVPGFLPLGFLATTLSMRLHRRNLGHPSSGFESLCC